MNDPNQENKSYHDSNKRSTKCKDKENIKFNKLEKKLENNHQ